MEITDIKIKHLNDEGRMRAVASVTFDHAFAVHDIKIIEGQDKYFLAMPSRRMPDGSYRDIVHPISAAMRTLLEDRVLALYHETAGQEGVDVVRESDLRAGADSVQPRPAQSTPDAELHPEDGNVQPQVMQSTPDAEL